MAPQRAHLLRHTPGSTPLPSPLEAIDDLAPADGSLSRLRRIRGLLRAMGFAARSRLTAVTSRALVEAIVGLGIVVTLEDGTELSPESESPGIHAKVRLRRVNVRWEAPRVVEPPPSLAPAELAHVHLLVLTALPDARRPSSPAWPAAFLESATRGVEISPEARRVLETTACNYDFGGNDPFPMLRKYSHLLRRDLLVALVGDLARLHRHLGDGVAVLVAELSQCTGFELPVPTIAADDPAPPPVRLARPGGRADGRSLGVLDDMFADLAPKKVVR